MFFILLYLVSILFNDTESENDYGNDIEGTYIENNEDIDLPKESKNFYNLFQRRNDVSPFKNKFIEYEDKHTLDESNEIELEVKSKNNVKEASRTSEVG